MEPTSNFFGKLFGKVRDLVDAKAIFNGTISNIIYGTILGVIVVAFGLFMLIFKSLPMQSFRDYVFLQASNKTCEIASPVFYNVMLAVLLVSIFILLLKAAKPIWLKSLIIIAWTVWPAWYFVADYQACQIANDFHRDIIAIEVSNEFSDSNDAALFAKIIKYKFSKVKTEKDAIEVFNEMRLGFGPSWRILPIIPTLPGVHKEDQRTFQYIRDQ